MRNGVGVAIIGDLVLAVTVRTTLLSRARACSAVAGAFLALLVLAGSSSAASPVDMRGSWACVSTVGSTRYPQTVRITSENFTTGQITGTDLGGGVTYGVSGTVTGNRFTMHISGGGYSSTVNGTVTGVLPHLSFTSSFSDSNHTTGSFTGQMTAAVATPGPSAAASAAAESPIATAPGTLPAETPAPTDVASSAPTADPGASNDVALLGPGDSAGAATAGPAMPSETPTPSDSNPFPLPLELAVAAALAAGLGAAALGLIPGVPGIANRTAMELNTREALDRMVQAAADNTARQAAMNLNTREALDRMVQAAADNTATNPPPDAANAVTDPGSGEAPPP